MFAARKMQYTFFIGIYEHDYCRKVYGPFSIKAVEKYDEEIVKMGAMGFNVAMPWKNWAFAQCDWTSASLKRNRTVNTIFKRQRAVFGSNTDAFDIELSASRAAVMKDTVLEYYLKNRR